MLKEGDKVRVVGDCKKIAGLMVGDIATVVLVGSEEYRPYVLVRSSDQRGYQAWFNPSDLEPITKQTLFEAAKDAPDGTRFKVAECGGEAVWYDGCLTWDRRHGSDVPMTVLIRTDFEIIPPGPRKRDKHTPENEAKRDAAWELINQLSLWEGAQIGMSGYLIAKYPEDERPTVYYVNEVSPYQVTFETPEQCIAAWQAEWPEALK